MEQNLCPISEFLTEFCNTKQSQVVDDTLSLSISSYTLEPDEVFGEVSNWVLNHFEQRKCPPELSTAVAITVATKLSVLASVADNKNDGQDFRVLYDEAIREVDSVCSSLLNEPDKIETIAHSCCKRFAVSSFAIRNKRRKMEDRYVVVHDLNAMLGLKDIPPHSYYAVFDGHAGAEAANYAASQLHVNLAKHPAFVSNTLNALQEAYAITHKRIIQKDLKSGCTAVSALIKDQTLFLAWLGDSQAFLVKQGKPFTIMNPHKPEREDERKRIEALGGIVTFYGTWRVNGNLSVSRALGDPDHKPFVSHEPDCTVIELDGSEDFLVLACDGLWDELTSDEAAATLYRYLNDSTIIDPVDSIAAKLIHQSKLQGSMDNITTIVIFLRDIECIRKDSLNFLPLFTQLDNKEDPFELSEYKEKESGIAKPNVLELNGTAAKKVNSFADMLNLPYNAQVNDQNTDLNSPNTKNNSHGNLGIGVPLEATSLSELPTPPIDDVFATQKFGQISATDLCQGLDKMTTDVDLRDKSDLLIQSDADSTYYSVDSHFDITKDSSGGDKTNPALEESSVLSADLSSEKYQNHLDSVPDDTLGIASTVVTNAIETAVKHISLNEIHSPSKSVQCSQKLNPYAEPFVMKSFVVEAESGGVNEAAQTLNDRKLSQSEHLSSDSLVSNPAKQVAESNSAENLLIDFPTVSSDTALKSDSTISQIDSPEQPSVPVLQNISKNELIQIDHPEELSKSCAFATEVPRIDEATVMDSHPGVSSDSSFKDKLDTSQFDASHSNYYKESVPSGNLNLLDSDVTRVQVLEAADGQMNQSGQLLEMNKLQESDVLQTKNKEKQDILNTVPDSLISVALSPEANQEKATQNNLILDQLTQKNLTSEPCTSHDEISLSEDKLISYESSLSQANSNDNTSALENQVTPTNLLGEVLVIPNIRDSKLPENVMQNEENDSKLLKDVEERFKTVTKESVENFDDPLCNVCLHSVPEGIPEAEGVTEDADSDSEKDGGWSYMKVNTVSSDKCAPEIQSKEKTKAGEKKVEKSTSSQNMKSSLESKLRIKTVETSLKTVSNKDSNAKEKIKIKGATLFPEKAKVSTLKLKKEVALPSTKAAPSKTIRLPVQRSQAAPVKTGTMSAATLSRPKPTVAPTEVKAAPCAGSSGTLASKPKTSSLGRNFSNRLSSAPAKSAPVSRPLSQLSKSVLPKPDSAAGETKPRPSSTIGFRAAKEKRSVPVSTTASTAMEAKTKPVTTAVRKTLSTVPKRPDIKEAKNTVNKRISAGKDETLASRDKKETLTSTPRPNIPSRKLLPFDERVLKPKPAQRPPGAEIDKITKKPIRSSGKTVIASRSTKEIKSNAAKSAKIAVDKMAKNKDPDSVKESNMEASCPTNASEQEKFLLEANVKEIFSNEQKTIEAKNELCTDSQNHEAVTSVNIEASESEIKSETEIVLPNAM